MTCGCVSISNCPLRETWAWKVLGLDRGLAGESQHRPASSSPPRPGLAMKQPHESVSLFLLNLHLQTSMCRRTTWRTLTWHTEAIRWAWVWAWELSFVTGFWVLLVLPGVTTLWDALVQAAPHTPASKQASVTPQDKDLFHLLSFSGGQCRKEADSSWSSLSHLGRNSCSETPDLSRRGMAGTPSGCGYPLMKPSPWWGNGWEQPEQCLVLCSIQGGACLDQSKGVSVHSNISFSAICFGRNVYKISSADDSQGRTSATWYSIKEKRGWVLAKCRRPSSLCRKERSPSDTAQGQSGLRDKKVCGQRE